MSIYPGTRMPSAKSTARQLLGMSLRARDATSTMTASSTSSSGCSMRSRGVNSVFAVIAIMAFQCYIAKRYSIVNSGVTRGEPPFECRKLGGQPARSQDEQSHDRMLYFLTESRDSQPKHSS